MALSLGLLIFSFLFTSILVVPFIDLLYKLKFQRLKESAHKDNKEANPLYFKLLKGKEGTPIGGGLLIIVVVTILYLVLFPLLSSLGIYISSAYPIRDEINIIFFTFISFGLLGFYDDLIKFFGLAEKGIRGLRLRHKFILQWVLGFIVAFLLYQNLKVDFIFVPFIGIIKMGIWYLPFAALTIIAFANAFNFTDGMDGLATGILVIYLFAFWFVSYTMFDTVLSVFIPIWIGSLIAFLYFNVFPARIFLGDVGALSFGATLAVVGLLLGKIIAVLVIGGIFVFEAASSLGQMLSLKFFHRRILPIAPFHLTLKAMGWEEPKIVMRAWLAALMLAIIGLWLAYI
jgi:phospho-N-acetylmuramoyl-pentapeptide-transferase